ncbi:caveolin-1-like [Glandiceps talaboti]
MGNSVGSGESSNSVIEMTGAEVTADAAEKIAGGVKELLLGPKKMNENIYNFDHHVELDFPEVFQAPKTSRNWGPILRANRLLYSVTQDFVYRVWVVVLGWLLALLWGILFGTFNFLTVWLLQPIWKIVFVVVRNVAIPYTVIIRAALDPIFESIGHILSHIRAGVFLRAQGMTMDVVKTV